MRRTAWPRLALVTAVAAVVGVAVLRMAESRGIGLLPVPAIAWAVELLIAAVVVGLGWNVRQFTRGRRPGLDPLVAARIVALATAAAYTGALLAGWYAAQVLVTVGDWHVAGRRDVAVSAGVAALAALVLAAGGLVAERWCEVPPPDDDETGGSSAASSSTA